MYKVLQSNKHYQLEKRTSRQNEVELLNMSKEGKLLRLEGVDFDMKLRK